MTKMGEVMVSKKDNVANPSGRETVNTFAEALENAVHFQEYLKTNETLRLKLSQYTHWYYFEKKNIFAPSKFIGYKNNTYNSESAHLGDGRETEKALSHIFKKVTENNEQPDIYVNELYSKLAALLNKYGKKPKKSAVIHIPREHIKQ